MKKAKQSQAWRRPHPLLPDRGLLIRPRSHPQQVRRMWKHTRSLLSSRTLLPRSDLFIVLSQKQARPPIIWVYFTFILSYWSYPPTSLYLSFLDIHYDELGHALTKCPMLTYIVRTIYGNIYMYIIVQSYSTRTFVGNLACLYMQEHANAAIAMLLYR